MPQALLEACKAGDFARVAELLHQGASAQPALCRCASPQVACICQWRGRNKRQRCRRSTR